ncbi:unnamed protein product [Linum tenue]|uniref:Uncharacterized protein n=1 Tax=Linum tenue TaxID=586396 RepID=A0AAV0H3Y0_9ROSI|nr:unnamed protein product [Linum tenue]
MEFRPRNYIAEEETHSLTRSAADHHPLSAVPPSSSAPPPPENKLSNSEDANFFDPLRGERRGGDSISIDEAPDRRSAAPYPQAPSKEWSSFKRLLMQKFPVSKMIAVSSVSSSAVCECAAFEKPDRTMLVDELDDVENEGLKVITQQEYVSRLYDLKDEINRAWNSDDRVTALKLSIKVAKLLVDTSVLQFYPTLFVLATDVMDMLGELVWKRIRHKAEYAEDGSMLDILPENFKANNVCFDAKETCNNWFCKVGAVRELLPRIYLELAILPCWRFLLDRPEDNLQRLVMMIRGLADPLASAYCRLYMVHCAQKLHTSDKGHLIACINDLNILFMRPASAKETRHGYLTDKKKLLVTLIDPAIEYIMKCIFDNASKVRVHIDDALVGLRLARNQVDIVERPAFVSIVLHHLLKELPAEILNSHAQDFLHLIQFSKDYTFDQCLNYRLLGFRLGEHRSQIEVLNLVLEEVMQAISQYERLDEFLNVVDAYIDIVLQNQMDGYLSSILKALAMRTSSKEVTEDDSRILQSIMIKLLSRLKDLDEIFALSHFLDILDVMYGRSRNAVNLHILDMATRKGRLRDPAAIQLLFEISQSLHDGIDLSHEKDDYARQLARLISRFVQMVDYGTELEQHLMFLVECRGAFGGINELKETLVHSSNSLATEALKDDKKQSTLVKSCIAFSEVTIPSIPTQVRQLNLYLETTEVVFSSSNWLHY